MPRAPTKIRKRFIEGKSHVIDYELEETLVNGCFWLFGPPAMLRYRWEWQRSWDAYGDIILPKVIEYRPGTRPFAMYAIGLIPRRELRMPLPRPHGFWSVDVTEENGEPTKHWLDVPARYMEPEAKYLRRLGIVSEDEYQRHREWRRKGGDPYRLEVSLYE